MTALFPSCSGTRRFQARSLRPYASGRHGRKQVHRLIRHCAAQPTSGPRSGSADARLWRAGRQRCACRMCLLVAAGLLSMQLSIRASAETPLPADQVVDSVGINLHLHSTDTPYANFPLVRDSLVDLGIRHVRDGLIDTTWLEYYRRYRDLAGLGIRGLFITSPKDSD